MEWLHLVGAIGDWAGRRGPLYRRLAEALAAAIEYGSLPSGLRLPSERQLAQSLAVSRTTVVAAYALLRQEGLVFSRQGSGTRVAYRSEALDPRPMTSALSALKQAPADRDAVIDCAATSIRGTHGFPPEAFELDARLVRQHAGMSAYEPLGLPVLRTAVADRYSEQGLATNADQILITTGAQQAIDLLFSFYAHDQAAIGVESPTYFGALDAARAAGAMLVSIPSDGEGPDPDAIAELSSRTRLRLLYLMTACHNPTGAVMGTDRRLALAHVAGEVGAILVDDAALADLRFGDTPPLLLPSSEHVVLVGSLSKLFWPGLRVGWLRAPEAVISRLARLKIVADLGSSQISQLLATNLLPRIDQIRSLRRQQLEAGLSVLDDRLRVELPTWSWRRPSGGPSLWVRLPRGDGEIFAQLALRYGVRVLPGARMAADGAHADCLRISFVAGPSQLQRAVDRLKEAWVEFDVGFTDQVSAAAAM